MRKRSFLLMLAVAALAAAACLTLLVSAVDGTAADGTEGGSFNGLPAKVAEDGGLIISKDNFPDDVFCAYVKTLDPNGDGKLSLDEAKGITKIVLTGSGVTTLSGIGYFSELDTLFCANNKITELDLTHNTKLEMLECEDNGLKTLNLSGLTKLWHLWIRGNALTHLELDCAPDLDQNDGYDESIEYFQHPKTSVAMEKGDDGKYRVDMKALVGEENLKNIAEVGGGTFDAKTGCAVFDAPVEYLLYTYDMNIDSYYYLVVIVPVDIEVTAPAPEKREPYVPTDDEIIAKFSYMGELFTNNGSLSLNYSAPDIDDYEVLHGESVPSGYAFSTIAVNYFEEGLYVSTDKNEFGSISIVPYYAVERRAAEMFASFEHMRDDEEGAAVAETVLWSYNKEMDSVVRMHFGGAGGPPDLMLEAMNYVVYNDEDGKPCRIVVQGADVGTGEVYRDYWIDDDGKVVADNVFAAREMTLVWSEEFSSWVLDEWKIIDYTVDENGVYFPPLEPQGADVHVIVPGTGLLVLLSANEIDEADAEYKDIAASVGAKYGEFVPVSLELLSDGKPVQPNGTVTVKMAVPEGWKAEDTGVVHVGEDGVLELIKTTPSEDGAYVTFETDHFSIFSLVKLSTEKDDTPTTDAPTTDAPTTDKPTTDKPSVPNTGDESRIVTAAVMLMLSAAAAAAAAFAQRRGKENK